MKKMMKLSLVAAVAVAGFSTSASASSMENAIKNTTIGGYVRYRFNDTYSDAANSDSSSEQVKVLATIKSKVNDNVTAVVQGLAVNGQDNGEVVHYSDATTGNTVGGMDVSAANFVYTNGAASVTVGLQALATPWTDAADGARANGVLGTYNLGSVTLAAAYFRDSRQGGDKNANIDANELGAVAAIGKAGPVSYQAWYLKISSIATDGTANGAGSSLAQGGDAVALLANAKFGPVAVDASYASLDGDDLPDKQTLSKVVVTGDLGVATLVGGYAVGGKDGDLVTFDPDAKVGFESPVAVRAGKGGQYDLDAYTAAVVVPVGAVAIKAQYTDATYYSATVHTALNEMEVDESLIQVSYKMSKNFSSYVRYAMVDYNKNAETAGNADKDVARIELKYTF